MLCLGNLGEWFGETGKLMGGWLGDWWEIDKSLTENRVNWWSQGQFEDLKRCVKQFFKDQF